MAVCSLCKTQIPESEEYCKDCYDKNRAKFNESYLDNLLASVTNNPNNMQPQKIRPDVNSDFTNMSNNNGLSAFEDKILLNRRKTQNITKQDEKILRDEFDKENEVNKTTEDDILSMLQDFEDENHMDDADETYFDPDENIEMEDTDEDLLALLDMISAQDEANIAKNSISASDKAVNNEVNSTQDEVMAEPQDLFSIEDLPSEIADGFEEELPQEDKPLGASDVGGIFSDVLSAVDTLSDKEEPKPDIGIPSAPAAKALEPAESKAEKKMSFFQKVFGKKNKKKSDGDSADGKLAEDAKAGKKAEKKKAEKAKKKTEPKKIAKKVSANKAAEEKEETDKKAKAKQKKEAKKKQVKKKPAVKAKKAKKEPKPKKAEVVADPEDNIKINKLAVIFVMTFFILIGGFVIIGTDTYSYSLDIENANTDFSRRRYDEAYNDIYGLDIREKDEVIYNKIMTVMFIQKELNSYQNYLDINMYPEALDSLLKGLKRYDKHIKTAADLGIKSDLDYVKEQILDKLDKQFNITEKEAAALNDSEDQTQYSIKVINTVLEKGE